MRTLAGSVLAGGALPLLAMSSKAEEASSSQLTSDVTTSPSAVDDQREFFYRPKDAWAGDFIPYYSDGQFHLYYLVNWRDEHHGEGIPWYKITSKDFVHFTEYGEVLPRGTRDEQDLGVFTGSVVFGEGQYHIFYAGHNPYFRAKGKPEQGIMHAVSDDLLHWRKRPEDTFYAPPERFERNDWRDPFVFWNEQAGEYWMLVAARLNSGPKRRRGCTGLCTSKDLKKWTVREPFWAPHLYSAHECPDLFRIGDWWYLVFSEFSDLVRTRYRKSRSLAGPWITPERDCFDSQAFYAAKTASNGRDHFLFGWNPTRDAASDSAPWSWGGNLVVHRIRQERDGSLAVDIPPSVDAAWIRSVPFEFSTQYGQVRQDGKRLQLTAPTSFACAAAGVMPRQCKIEALMQFDPGTRGCGLMLRTDDAMETSYYLRFEPINGRMVFDRWPRRSSSGELVVHGDHMAGLDRWVHLDPATAVNLKVIVDDTMATAYVDDSIAMSVRMYDLSRGRWGFFVDEGAVRLTEIKLLMR